MRARIVVHTPEPYSGAAQYVAELVRALHESGENTVLFCPRNFAYKPGLSDAGVAVVDSGDRSTASAGLIARIARNLRFLAATCQRQIRLIRSNDIVHFQFPLYFPAGLALFLLARIQARAIVYTAHDPVPHKWLFPRVLRFVERGSLHWAYMLSDRIIVHNEAAKELLAREFSQSAAKISVIPHGASALKPADVSFKNSATLDLLIFGSIREDKGVNLAIAAIQRINANGLRVRLLIAGAVANAREQAYWDTCVRQVEQSGSGITIIEKFIPDAVVPALLAECDAVLLPYRNFESESGVAAIAIANGRAILATNTGSFSALLDSADLGIPIQSPSVEAVEESIRVALATGPLELRAKGLRGLEFATSSRSWENVGKQTARLYADVRLATMSSEI